MKRLDISIISILISMFVVLLVGIFYISVLGENNKATIKARQFVENIKNGNYSDMQLSYFPMRKTEAVSEGDLIKYHVALELAMLDHFCLTGKEDYGIRIERENLWIPFFKTDNLKLNVFLFKKNDSNIFFNHSKNSDLKPLRGLFVYGRKSGQWELRKINIETSPINNIFSELIYSLDLDRYILTTDKGFDINENDINVAGLSMFEKRVMILNFQKALEILRESN